MSRRRNDERSERGHAWGPPAADWRERALAAFDESGAIAGLLPGYEPRPGQSDMARTVMRSLAEDRHAVVEAGTGVGKSLAYLVPAVLSRQQVVVATATRGLQDQLWNKDLPFLREVLGGFSAALVKGMSNYLCLDRFFDQGQQAELAFDKARAGRETIERWRRTTDTGEVDELAGELPNEYLSQYTVDSDGCLGSACRFAEQGCFALSARRRAREAQIVVANHSLLCSDLAIRASTDGKAGLLPPADAYVIDEAHQLEAAATGAFERRLSHYAVARLCGDRFLRRFVPIEDLAPIVDANDRLFRAVDRLSPTRRFALTSGVREAAEVYALLDKLATRLANERGDAVLPADEDKVRYDKIVVRALQLSETAKSLALDGNAPGTVRFAERADAGSRVRVVVHVAPIEVADQLSESLFGAATVICTSATIAAAGEQDAFAYFRARVGCPADALQTLAASPFDYQEQSLLYLPPRMPEPGRGEDFAWDAAVAREITQLVAASRGRAFLLFTSGHAMQRTYRAISEALGFPCFVQGDLPRHELLETFKSTPGAVLFGLRSFWEGVDVPGDALSLVVIDRLPFAVPDDPVVQARVDRIKEQGGNWFGGYTLPSATLQLKQGFGRLIRRRADRGVVAILDPRLTTRHYGRTVVRALPPARVTRDIGLVRDFFAAASE